MWILTVVEALQKAKVDFAVVGGYAVALHGAVRGTIDLDIVLTLSEKNLWSSEKVLIKLGMVSRLPVTASEIFRFRQEYIRERNLIAWSFLDPQDPSHVVDIVITHDLCRSELTHIKVGRISIPVLSKCALIKMKTKAGRPQDLEDVRALENLD